MDVLANDPSPDDIVQLALLQPNASEVFVQASARVKGDRKKSWFKWRWEGLTFYMYIVQPSFTCNVCTASLGVLCCFALFVCLTLLLFYFLLISH